MENETQLLRDMRELKADIEYKQNKDIKNRSSDEKMQIIVQDITFYGQIKIINPKTKQEENKNIYKVQKRAGNNETIEFYADNEIIAKMIDNENQIIISPKYAQIISAEIFLIKMQDLKIQEKEQISLKKLEEMEKEREIGLGLNNKKKSEQNKPKEQEDKPKQQNENEKQQQDKEKSKDNYIEISMKQRITTDKTIADLIPELKQKNCERVIIKSQNNIDFKVYGIDKAGNEIQLETIEQTEGTNPYQGMIKTNIDGTQVQAIRVSTMLKINSGTNEQRGNEGLGIKIGKMGIEEVLYYRRDQNDKYLAIPVGLETTNDKYATREVREIATKRYNPTIDDNVKRAEERTKGDSETTIKNIDDNKTNNTIDKTEEQLIKKAAKERCGGISIEGFLKVYNKANGDTIQEKIDNTVDTINEQYHIRDKV